MYYENFDIILPTLYSHSANDWTIYEDLTVVLYVSERAEERMNRYWFTNQWLV